MTEGDNGVLRVGLAVVRGRSMLPTLRDGDRLLVVYGMRPAVGSLVVVRLPGRPVAVKRVVRRMPDGWWVERDNPTEGVDSWLAGAVPEDDVVAVALARLWPPRLWHPRLQPPPSWPGRLSLVWLWQRLRSGRFNRAAGPPRQRQDRPR